MWDWLFSLIGKKGEGQKASEAAIQTPPPVNPQQQPAVGAAAGASQPTQTNALGMTNQQTGQVMNSLIASGDEAQQRRQKAMQPPPNMFQGFM